VFSVVILYMWIVVASFLMRLQKAANMEKVKENTLVDVNDMVMVQRINKGDGGPDMFVMAMKE
jgi:UDP-N-acetyl-D-mannosaminuronate dehydrogenase